MLRRRCFFSLVVWTTLVLSATSTLVDKPAQLRLTDEDQPMKLGHEKEEHHPYLNFSSSAPYLFASTYSLLQQWSNTIFPNGHSIAPCEIPAYTLFYHGRLDSDVPPSPEWFAFDIEMAYGIMGSNRNSWLLTFQTTRPVRALYFDGESAALMGLGQLDTQMLHLYGNVSGPPPPAGINPPWQHSLWPEYARARGLCDWLLDAGLRGPGWGFEGVVRMNAGFELIWCDFTSPSLRLLTQVNVTAPQLPPEPESTAGEAEGEETDGQSGGTSQSQQSEPAAAESYYTLPPQPTRTDRSVDPTNPPNPPNWRRDAAREPFLGVQGWGWFDSATWHYGSSGTGGPGRGEIRARVLSCGLLSWYSPRLTIQSLHRARLERAELNLTAEGFWKGGDGEDEEEGAVGDRSVALKQLARRRRHHHLGDVTREEALVMHEATETALRRLLDPPLGGNGESACTGFDWVLTTNEIVQRTSLQLKMIAGGIAAFLDSPANMAYLRAWLANLRGHTHLFLVGYLEYPTTIDSGTWAIDSELFNETYLRCRYRYTRLLAPDEGVVLNPEEEDLRWAVEETWGNICMTFLRLGFSTERMWHDKFGGSDASGGVEDTGRGAQLRRQAVSWSNQIAELIAWLGWESEFTGCDKVCEWDERCFIPMWPLLGRRGFGPLPPDDHVRIPKRSLIWTGNDKDLWEPKCVKADYIMSR